MKGRMVGLIWAAWGLGLAMAGPVGGAEGGSVTESLPGIRLEADAALKRNHVGINYWMGFNVGVDFKRIGGYPAQTDVGPATGGGVDRFYDDGYVQVDSSGNAGGYTWYWGYGTSGQVPGNDSVVMNSSSSLERASEKDVDDGINHGIELTYRRDVGPLWKGRWGVEGAFGYTSYDMVDNNNHYTRVTRVSDSYALNGVVPPLAPYQGTFQGPGPVVSDSPQRVVQLTSQTATITGRREFEADLFAFRVGPYWEVPVYKRISASLSGGLAFAVLNSEFTWNETVTIEDLPSVSRAGSESETDVLLGAYVAGSFSYHFSESWRATVGAEYIYLGEYDQDSGDKTAVADFDGSIFVSIGLGYSF